MDLYSVFGVAHDATGSSAIQNNGVSTTCALLRNNHGLKDAVEANTCHQGSKTVTGQQASTCQTGSKATRGRKASTCHQDYVYGTAGQYAPHQGSKTVTGRQASTRRTGSKATTARAAHAIRVPRRSRDGRPVRAGRVPRLPRHGSTPSGFQDVYGTAGQYAPEEFQGYYGWKTSTCHQGSTTASRRQASTSWRHRLRHLGQPAAPGFFMKMPVVQQRNS